MSNKTELIKFRVTSDEKLKANKIVQFLKKKNISTLFRDYILDLSDFIDEIELTTNDPLGISLDDIIDDYKSQLALVQISKENPYHSFELKRKINLLNEIKEDFSK